MLNCEDSVEIHTRLKEEPLLVDTQAPFCTEPARGHGEVQDWVTAAMLLSPQERPVQGWMV